MFMLAMELKLIVILEVLVGPRMLKREAFAPPVRTVAAALRDLFSPSSSPKQHPAASMSLLRLFSRILGKAILLAPAA